MAEELSSFEGDWSGWGVRREDGGWDWGVRADREVVLEWTRSPPAENERPTSRGVLAVRDWLFPSQA